MKSKFIQVPVALIVLASSVVAQGPRNSVKPDLSPQAQAARVEAAIETRHQRAREERTARVQLANESGIQVARQSRESDRDFMAVWSRIAPNTRKMPIARELAERLSKRPEWQNQTRAERIAAITAFITNYPAIKAARNRKAMDEALSKADADYPELPGAVKMPAVLTPELQGFPAMKPPVLFASSIQELSIPEIKPTGNPAQLAQTIRVPAIAEIAPPRIPDLFTINREFNWSKPHGQWMSQLLKDIDAAKAAGDTEAYDALQARYSAWAEKYLRRDDPPNLDGLR